jgi:hypothetical protein
MENLVERLIVPAEFPELKALVWNRDPACGIPAQEAFALYERNWRFVDRNRLSKHEARLIEDLARVFGHGRLLV